MWTKLPDRPRGLDEALEAEQVAADVPVQIGPASHEAGHGSLVDDDIHAAHDRLEVVTTQVELVKLETRRAKEVDKVPLLHRARVVIGEAVEAHDLLAVGQEPLGEVRIRQSRPRR